MPLKDNMAIYWGGTGVPSLAFLVCAMGGFCRGHECGQVVGSVQLSEKEQADPIY